MFSVALCLCVPLRCSTWLEGVLRGLRSNPTWVEPPTLPGLQGVCVVICVERRGYYVGPARMFLLALVGVTQPGGVMHRHMHAHMG